MENLTLRELLKNKEDEINFLLNGDRYVTLSLVRESHTSNMVNVGVVFCKEPHCYKFIGSFSREDTLAKVVERVKTTLLHSFKTEINGKEVEIEYSFLDFVDFYVDTYLYHDCETDNEMRIAKVMFYKLIEDLFVPMHEFSYSNLSWSYEDFLYHLTEKYEERKSL